MFILRKKSKFVEFQQKKNALMDEKKTLEEKLSDFERKGNHWLELTRNWIMEANQAKNIVCRENFSEMKNFLKTVGSNRRISARTLALDFKIPWNFLAETNAEAENAKQKPEQIRKCGPCRTRTGHLRCLPRTKKFWT